MIETSELGRLYMSAASNFAGSVADHHLRNMKLSGDSTLRSLEYMTQVAGAKSGLEVIELSRAQYRNQVNVLGCYTGNLIDLACKMPKDVAEPFRTRAVVASCVIL